MKLSDSFFLPLRDSDISRCFEWGAVEEKESVVTLAGLVPAFCFGNRIRHPGEYIGYTWFHLPKRFVASPAIFAARMARSNLAIRLALI